MKLNKIFLSLAVLAFAVVGAQAASSEQISKALDSAITQAEEKAKQEYKKFNPHLTKEQTAEIPVLLKGVAKRLQEDAVRPHMTVNDAMAGIWMYLDVVYGLSAPAGSTTIYEVNPDGTTTPVEYEYRLNKKGLLARRAWLYTISTLVPADMRKEVDPYRPADFPAVENWEEYHNLCQADMEEFYKLLKELQTCDWDRFSDVMCNLL